MKMVVSIQTYWQFQLKASAQTKEPEKMWQNIYELTKELNKPLQKKGVEGTESVNITAVLCARYAVIVSRYLCWQLCLIFANTTLSTTSMQSISRRRALTPPIPISSGHVSMTDSKTSACWQKTIRLMRISKSLPNILICQWIHLTPLFRLFSVIFVCCPLLLLALQGIEPQAL